MTLKCTNFKYNVMLIDKFLTSALLWRRQHRLYKKIDFFSQSNGMLKSKLKLFKCNTSRVEFKDKFSNS